MKDDQMDDLLMHGVRDYNEPGPVPREQMWGRIASERHARDASVALASPRRHWSWAVTGLAAAAVLTVGIAIGRRLERASPSPTAIPTTVNVPRPRPESLAATTKSSSDSIVTALRGETRRTGERAKQIAEGAAPANGTNGSIESDNLAYRLVVLRHLAGSEAMITAFRSSARSGEVDAQIGEWSRELLGTTRMLEASPVVQDPTMKRLLEDLDLVIAQIAQYVSTGKHNPDDLDLIEQSITKRGVITKLRSTLPARAAGS